MEEHYLIAYKCALVFRARFKKEDDEASAETQQSIKERTAQNERPGVSMCEIVQAFHQQFGENGYSQKAESSLVMGCSEDVTRQELPDGTLLLFVPIMSGRCGRSFDVVNSANFTHQSFGPDNAPIYRYNIYFFNPPDSDIFYAIFHRNGHYSNKTAFLHSVDDLYRPQGLRLSMTPISCPDQDDLSSATVSCIKYEVPKKYVPSDEADVLDSELNSQKTITGQATVVVSLKDNGGFFERLWKNKKLNQTPDHLKNGISKMISDVEGGEVAKKMSLELVLPGGRKKWVPFDDLERLFYTKDVSEAVASSEMPMDESLRELAIAYYNEIKETDK